jgi:hypothetical protein
MIFYFDTDCSVLVYLQIHRRGFESLIYFQYRGIYMPSSLVPLSHSRPDPRFNSRSSQTMSIHRATTTTATPIHSYIYNVSLFGFRMVPTLDRTYCCYSPSNLCVTSHLLQVVHGFNNLSRFTPSLVTICYRKALRLITFYNVW